MDTQSIIVLCIIGGASLLGSTFGFGYGLIGMPLMVMVLDVKMSASLIAVTSAFLSLFIFVSSCRELDFKSIWKLIVSSALGVPIGLYYLKGANESLMKTILALMVILFSLYSLFGKLKLTLKSDWPAYLFGLLAGIINGAYNMGGPPIMIYGTLKKWPPSSFRGNIYSHYFPLSIMIVVSHWIAGFINKPVLTHAALSLPLIVVTMIIGGKLNRSIPVKQFDIIIYLGLLLIGFLLIYKVASGFQP